MADGYACFLAVVALLLLRLSEEMGEAAFFFFFLLLRLSCEVKPSIAVIRMDF